MTPNEMANLRQQVDLYLQRERDLQRTLRASQMRPRPSQPYFPSLPSIPGDPGGWNFFRALIQSLGKLDYSPLLVYYAGDRYIALVREKLRLMEEIDRSAQLDREISEREDRLSPLERTRERLARYPASVRPLLDWKDP